MPRNRHRYFEEEEDEQFETEAFAHINEVQAEEIEDQEDEELEDSDPEDMQHIEDSDDEAPDDVGFHESRESVLTQLRSALRQVDVEKQKKKSKRKLLDAQFKEQKAKKQEELVNSKLPDDFLEGLEDEIPKKVQKTGQTVGRRRNSKKNNVNEAEHLGKDDVEKSGGSRRAVEREDYIAFTDKASGVQVADFRHVEKQGQSVTQAALDFRQNRLYGKGVKRESNQQRLSKAEKRRHRAR